MPYDTEANRAYMQRYAAEHRVEAKERMQRWLSDPVNFAKKRAADTSRHRQRLDMCRSILRELKSAPCSDCGNRFDPDCMDYDHPPGVVKLDNVNNFKRRGQVKAMLAEILKCDLVCACCHRLRTRKRRLAV